MSLVPLDITFFSTARGYEIVKISSRLYVATTADGGSSWTATSGVLAPPAPSTVNAAIGVTADGAVYTYVVSASVVEVSDDFGRMWHRAKLPGAVVDVTSAGSSLWALVDGPQRPPNHRNPVPPPKGSLYSSNDYGQSWTRVSTLPSDVGPYTLLIQPTANVAYALAPGENNTWAGRYGGLVRTTNGARTWDVEQQPCDLDAAPRFWDYVEFGAGSVKTLWMVCTTNDGGVITQVWRTTDGAARWSQVAFSNYGVVGNLPFTASAPSSSPVTTSVFTGEQAWLVLISPRLLVRTTDGGHKWANGAPSEIEKEGPQYVLDVDGTIVVRTRTSLWRLHGGVWNIAASTGGNR